MQSPRKRMISMSTAIRVEATVSPDGKIELSVPELLPGQHISITIEPDQPAPATQAPAAPIHIIDLIKDLPGRRLFKTADEVDEYLRQERNSWER
jgi:hypothetical protein